MTTPNIPHKYQRTGAARRRYLEGREDGKAGRPHAYAEADAAAGFVERYDQEQLTAYNEGYEAGHGAIHIDLLTRAHALLDELEHTPLATVHAGKLAELADRLQRVANMIQTSSDADLGRTTGPDYNRPGG
jgi:hypothetical protein